ncbi:MAG: U32 family peptidase [Anaerofustis sp.]
MKQPELLAPAGSLDILKTAIDAGADAVYFGGKSMNARRNAENFTRDEIAQSIRYAHIRGKKVYLTMNTLMYDSELREAADEICFLCEAGADALIVQDLGIVKLIREICPELPMHASTQMSAHNVSDCKMMEEMGFSRVVLAREMSREELRRVTETCDIETEVFVHGALCMSVSGQCYFSSALGERSGNRGLCAQVCRLPFYAEDPRRYALSLKDLSLIDRVSALREIGITSLKIEGRMKNAAYVQAVTSAYRAALENRQYSESNLAAVFSRSGFTKGYFDGKRGSSMFGIRTEEDKQLSVRPETQTEKRESAFGNIPIRMEYSAKSGKAFYLSVRDEDGHCAEVFGDVCQPAQKRGIENGQIQAQLEKLGGTAYRIESVEGETEDGLFLPLSSLNAVRREACEKLDDMRAMRPVRMCKDCRDASKKRRNGKKESAPLLYIRLASAKQYSKELFDLADRVYLPLSEIGDFISANPDSSKERIGIELPRIFFGDESKLREELKLSSESGIRDAMGHTLGKIKLALDAEFHVTAGFGANLANSLALKEMSSLGVREGVLSPEIQLQKIRELDRAFPVGIVAYGHFPLMIARNCPVSAETGCRNECCGLTDRKGKKFRVTCADGMSEILNGEAIYYADKLDQLAGLDFMLLHFTTESAQECCRIAKEYRLGGTRSGMTRGAYMRTIR